MKLKRERERERERERQMSQYKELFLHRMEWNGTERNGMERNGMVWKEKERNCIALHCIALNGSLCSILLSFQSKACNLLYFYQLFYMYLIT